MLKRAARAWSTWSFGTLACALACHSRAPVAPSAPPAPAPTAEVPPPPPPPPPKCESLEEACKATSDTQVEVPESGLMLTPPEGWVYAREPGMLVTVAPAGTAKLALAPAASDARTPVIETVEKLLARLEIDKLNIKSLRTRLGKADGELDTGKLKLRLWEVDKRRQRGKSPELKDKGQGTVLVALAPASDGKVVVGAAFVVNPDSDSLAGVVMKSIQSLWAPP